MKLLNIHFIHFLKSGPLNYMIFFFFFAIDKTAIDALQ